jgi:hypothetical protein
MINRARREVLVVGVVALVIVCVWVGVGHGGIETALDIGVDTVF